MLTSAQERIAVLSRAGASGSQYSHGPFFYETPGLCQVVIEEFR